jgi:hypothetical protein
MRKDMLTIRLALACLCILPGCGWDVEPLLPLPPIAPNSALIGIMVHTKAPKSEKIMNLGIPTNEFPHVAFVKLGEGEDILTSSTWLADSHEDFDGRAYLLDAEPGEYVAVALRADVSTGSPPVDVSKFTFLSEELIAITRVTVTPGGVVFMGDFTIDRKRDDESYDRAQKHYRELLTAGVKGHNVYYAGALRECHKDKATEVKFFRDTAKLFQGSPWAQIVEAHLHELNAD